MSEYLMQDVKAFYLIKSLLDKPHNLSKLVTTDKGGLIRAGRQGVWLSPGHSNVFHACRGSIMGNKEIFNSQLEVHINNHFVIILAFVKVNHTCLKITLNKLLILFICMDATALSHHNTGTLYYALIYCHFVIIFRT